MDGKVAEDAVRETGRIYITPAEFTAYPHLFDTFERWWRDKNWYALVGEWPEDGRLFSTIPPEGGVQVWWHRKPEHAGTPVNPKWRAALDTP